MKLFFKDQAFSFELLRAASYAGYQGAEIGECLATAAKIEEETLKAGSRSGKNSRQNL